MKKIVMTPNPYRDRNFKYANQAQKILEDAPDDGGFLRYWHQRIAFPAIPINPEATVRDALLHALPGAPFHIL